MTNLERQPQQFRQTAVLKFLGRENPGISFEFTHKRKPSGSKKERRKNKLPNEIRHDQNAAISVGTWKKRGKEKNQDKTIPLSKQRLK